MGAQAARLAQGSPAESQQAQAEWDAWQAEQSKAGPEVAEVLIGFKRVLDGFKMVLRGLSEGFKMALRRF